MLTHRTEWTGALVLGALFALAASACASNDRAVADKPAPTPAQPSGSEPAPPAQPSGSAAAEAVNPRVEAAHKSCEDDGDAMECFSLGYAYENGKGLPKGEARAMPLYQKGCDLGFGPSCYNLGRMFADGRGAPKDDARALELYRKACTGGVKPACARLPDAGG